MQLGEDELDWCWGFPQLDGDERNKAEVGYGLIDISLLSHAAADMKKLSIKLGEGLLKINKMAAT